MADNCCEFQARFTGQAIPAAVGLRACLSNVDDGSRETFTVHAWGVCVETLIRCSDDEPVKAICSSCGRLADVGPARLQAMIELEEPGVLVPVPASLETNPRAYSLIGIYGDTPEERERMESDLGETATLLADLDKRRLDGQRH